MNANQILEDIARTAMLARGLAPDFTVPVMKQLDRMDKPATTNLSDLKDARELLWCSIDNDDSKDLDQLTAAKKVNENEFIIYIAVADVDALVHKETPIDQHAQINTTSIYTPAKIFPMLPEKLSTNLTSLNEREDRVAVIFEIHLNSAADVLSTDIYHATVYNYAQLAYSSVGAWLEGRGNIPDKLDKNKELAENIKLQNTLAQAIKKKRRRDGALTLETIEVKPILSDGVVSRLDQTEHNVAHELIENFMIAANSASAKYTLAHRIPGLRRVVKVPERWDRIVMLAKEKGEFLPDVPDSKALDDLLIKLKAKDPATFPDVSLTVIKLLGSGEYTVEIPGDQPQGHFGLALRDYTHSTAPNRRFPDLITQRLLKDSLRGQSLPYTIAQLQKIAENCTEKEDLAQKVERQVKKSAEAMMLSSHINEVFPAIVTGASAKGTWVRVQNPPVEGKLVLGVKGLDVGDRLSVRLVSVDVARGFIDFVREK